MDIQETPLSKSPSTLIDVIVVFDVRGGSIGCLRGSANAYRSILGRIAVRTNNEGDSESLLLTKDINMGASV